jgi:hypothetical protein
MTTQMTQPLVSTRTRIATALGVVALVAAAWGAAGHESGKAVIASAAAFGPKPVYVTLPSVEIVGHRESAPAATAFAGSGEQQGTNEL